MNSPRVLTDFLGCWQITRRIEDDHAGQVITGSGQGIFAADPDVSGGLIYDERLVMQFPGQAPMQATRRYLWRDDAGKVQVLFADERPFHVVFLAETAPQDRHYCDPDVYDVAYDFSLWPRWSALWSVQGPRKGYRMHSSFARHAVGT